MNIYAFFLLVSLIVNAILVFMMIRSNTARRAGTIKIFTNPDEKKVYSLELNVEPEDLDDQKYVIFKIDANPPS